MAHEFEIVILGSGTAVPAIGRSPSGLLVRAGGRTILADAGAGTAQRLLQAGVSLSDLDAIFFSHLHVDHIADLVPILNALSIPHEGPARDRDLPLHGPVGFAAHVEGLRRVYGDAMEPTTCTAPVRELQDCESVDFGPLRVTARKVRHRGECLAYRFAFGDAVAVYSGDSGECEELVRAAEGASVFVCECSFTDGRDTSFHLTPSAAGRIARKAGVGKLVLTHLYPEVDKTNVEAIARADFRGEVVRAEDGMRLAMDT